jgi:hypothetical protein
VILAVFALFVIGCRLYIYTTTKTVSDTASWKTYSNDKYGFEFQAPPDLAFQSLSIPIPTIARYNIPLSDGVIALLPSSYSLPDSLQSSQTLFAGITSATSSVVCMPQSYVKNDNEYGNPTAIKAGSLTFQKYAFIGDCGMDGCTVKNTYTIWHGNMCYEIGSYLFQAPISKSYEINDGTSSSELIATSEKDAKTTTEVIVSLTEKMLSTFKFTK